MCLSGRVKKLGIRGREVPGIWYTRVCRLSRQSGVYGYKNVWVMQV